MSRRPFPGSTPPSRLPSSDEDFGLVGWLENTRVVLPLKGVDCRFSVCGGVASVRTDQVFFQENPNPLNCTYTFPLPHGAAVYRCEMIVNERVITAKVEEEQTAREIAREKAAEGRRTALVEVERDNLFTLSLGNVQPEDLVIVRLAFFQAVEHLGDERSLRIPFSPGVRYIPGKKLLRENRGAGTIDDTDQVPDASRISPPRIDEFHPDATALFVHGTIQSAGEAPPEISSPSHPIKVCQSADNLVIDLAKAGDLPNRDLVIRWTEETPETEQLSAWVSRGQDESAYSLVELRAPQTPAGGEQLEQDVYFLIDQSGSMGGTKWDKAAKAFRSFLEVLGAGDRVFATLFETDFQDLAEKPLNAKNLLEDTGVQSLEDLGTLGGTELLPAIEHVLQVMDKHSVKRPVTLVLITDGQVGNESEVLETLKKRPDLRVHTFGIDTAVNDAFLQEMASQQRGTCCLRTPEDDIEGAVAELGAMIGSPTLRNLEVEGPWETPGGAIPDLFAGQVVSVLLKNTRESTIADSDRESLRITGLLTDESKKTYKIEARGVSEPAIELLWAKRRIAHLIAEDNQDAALEIAREKNILCRGAAFVAWDEAEKVAVAGPEDELVQPVMSPARHAMEIGMSYCLASPPCAASDEDEDMAMFASSDHLSPGYRKTSLVLRELCEENGLANLAEETDLISRLAAWVDGEEPLSADRLELLRVFFEILREGLRARDRLRSVLEKARAILPHISESIDPGQISLMRGSPPVDDINTARDVLAHAASASEDFERLSALLRKHLARLEKALGAEYPEFRQRILEPLEHVLVML